MLNRTSKKEGTNEIVPLLSYLPPVEALALIFFTFSE